MATIGLVTVLYNGAAVLEGFIASVARQRGVDYTLYAVDNASKDDSAAMLDRLAHAAKIPYRLVRNAENAGVAKANNQGIAMALEDGCEYVIILNNDIEFGEATLAGLLERARSTGYFMLAPKVSFHGTGTIWFAGGGFSPLRGTNVHWHSGKPMATHGTQEKKIDYAPTCFVLVHRDVFARVGLMYEPYFVYYDDSDFMLRAKKARVGMLFVPDFEISHKVSSSTGGGESDFTYYYTNRNRVIFLRRNYPFPLSALYCLEFLAMKALKSFTVKSPRRELLKKALRDGFRQPL